MSVKKQYLKGKDTCKVTFTIPKSEVENFEKAAVVGEFNSWDTAATEMKKKRDGAYSATLELEPGRSYQFRYLINDDNWRNDSEADGYVPNPYGNGENCILEL